MCYKQHLHPETHTAFYGFPPAVPANYDTDAYRDLSKSFYTTWLRVGGRNAALRLASSPTAPQQDGQSRSAGSVPWEATTCTCLLCKLMLSQQIPSPLALLDPPAESRSYLLTNCRVQDEPRETLRLMSGESSTKLARLGRIKIHSNCNFSSEMKEKERSTPTLRRLGGKMPCTRQRAAPPMCVEPVHARFNTLSPQ